MRFAIQTVSAFRNGRTGVISNEMIACNHIHAYSLSEVKWFNSTMQAEKYKDLYLQKGEQAVIVDEVQVLMNKEYFK